MPSIMADKPALIFENELPHITISKQKEKITHATLEIKFCVLIV